MWQRGPFQSGLHGEIHIAALVVRKGMSFPRLHEPPSPVNVVSLNKLLQIDKHNLKRSINPEWTQSFIL